MRVVFKRSIERKALKERARAFYATIDPASRQIPGGRLAVGAVVHGAVDGDTRPVERPRALDSIIATADQAISRRPYIYLSVSVFHLCWPREQNAVCTIAEKETMGK